MMIAHSRPWIAAADREAVEAVLRSELVAQGDATRRFEAAMSRWLAVDQPGVAVASGAAAVQLALVSLGVGAGDEVVLPTYVCRSVLEAVRSTGAQPIVADVGPQFVMTPANVASLVNRGTRAIIVPHLYGIFADIAAFRTFGIPIVEDCAQALDRPARHPVSGDVAVFSFHPTKCLTTGEGGLAVSADPHLNRQLRAARDEGLRHRRVFAPMSDMAAALGLSQLARYDEMLRRRRAIAEAYKAALGEAGPRLLRRTPWNRTMHFRFVLSSEGGIDRAGAAFAREGIVARRGVDQLLHRLEGLDDERFPMATDLFETTVSVPIYPALGDADVVTCAGALGAFCLEPTSRR